MESTSHWITKAALAALIVSGMSELAGSAAFAEEHHHGTQPRINLSLGPWIGSFTQEGTGHTSAMAVTPAVGTELNVGVRFAELFVIEYAPTWYMVQKFADNSDKTNDSSYVTWAAVQAGVHVPLVDLEALLGYEYGDFTFSTGTQGSFKGNALKLGFKWLPPGSSHFGVVVEYRHHYLRGDQEGNFPSGITTSLTTWFAGVTFGSY